ncbi:MAG: hypothetical protein PHS92_04670 [Candidatus Gracilibacteria bacterium]|nr:hypothetical protein [Candidatus Gracilibacteria bacterium]
MQNSPGSSYEREDDLNERFRKRLNVIKAYFLDAKQRYGIDFVLSKELERIDFRKVEIVLVGDNPGKDELKNNEFFSMQGSAGVMARKLFNTIYGEESFERNVLVLNKTLFHTNRTAQLKGSNGADLLEESQTLMADFLIDFLKEKKVPVIVVGFAEMEGFFKTYFSLLKEKGASMNMLDSIFVTPHFSLSKIFCKHKNEHWNGLIDAFLAKYPYLATDKGNISSKAFYASQDERIFKDFLNGVLMKQTILDY